jgi:tetratricopeptide (TPR) repeat protein
VSYQNLGEVLVEMGREDEAEQVTARFAATKADPPHAAEMRGTVHYWAGNLADGDRAFRTAIAGGSTGPFLQLYLAYLYNLLDSPQEAEVALPDEYRPFVAPYWRGDYQAVATQYAALGVDMWNIWNLPQTLGKALVHAGRGDEFVSLFDRRWKGFDQYVRKQTCGLYLIGPTLALALRQAGRDAEAARVVSATEAEHRMRVKNGLRADSALVEHAAILMLQGRREQALGKLEAAIARGWVNQGEPFWVGLNDPAFAPLASEPRFRALKGRLAATLAEHAAAVRKLEEPKAQTGN